jgi:hypothetical protein
MPTPISKLPLHELVQMYHTAHIVRTRMKVRPWLYMWSLTHLEVDMELLYAAMVPKIPDSHLLEIRKLLIKVK